MAGDDPFLLGPGNVSGGHVSFWGGCVYIYIYCEYFCIFICHIGTLKVSDICLSKFTQKDISTTTSFKLSLDTWIVGWLVGLLNDP